MRAVRVLADHYADWDILDNDGYSALHCAARGGLAQTLRNMFIIPGNSGTYATKLLLFLSWCWLAPGGFSGTGWSDTIQSQRVCKCSRMPLPRVCVDQPPGQAIEADNLASSVGREAGRRRGARQLGQLASKRATA